MPAPRRSWRSWVRSASFGTPSETRHSPDGRGESKSFSRLDDPGPRPSSLRRASSPAARVGAHAYRLDVFAQRFRRGGFGRPDRRRRRVADDADAGPAVRREPGDRRRHRPPLRRRHQERRRRRARPQRHDRLAHRSAPRAGQRAGHGRHHRGARPRRHPCPRAAQPDLDGARGRAGADGRSDHPAQAPARPARARHGRAVGTPPRGADGRPGALPRRLRFDLLGGCWGDRCHRAAHALPARADRAGRRRRHRPRRAAHSSSRGSAIGGSAPWIGPCSARCWSARCRGSRWRASSPAARPTRCCARSWRRCSPSSGCAWRSDLTPGVAAGARAEIHDR